jgi:hypothetical protein
MSELHEAPAEVVGICHRCRHLDRTPEGEGMRCNAYPEGIPIEIRIGILDHRRPLSGDHGIQFRERRTT